MQTFLPYADFEKSAACLDRMRLGKQRSECLQIVNTLLGLSQGWRNHPAVRMWRGYIPALVSYGQIVCEEWMSRGYRDSIWEKLAPHANGVIIMPHWMGNAKLHDSHKSNLLRKDPQYYEQFGWTVPLGLFYWWPT
jgi:Pyrimidine dimer DNA glycosylase